MEALPASVLAVDLPRPEDVPWSFLMAFVSLGLIYALFRFRGDVFHDLRMSGKDVALLCLGSIAGWAVNIPLWISGETYLMVNVGGTIVPILLITWWIRSRALPLIPTIIGTAVVSLIAWRVVSFHPELGIISTFPWFFLPIAGALIFGLLVSLRRPLVGAPIAYASGSLGALIGADLMHVPEIHGHFQAATTRTIISIGGAGVFDMVFLAGTCAMALHLGIVVLFGARGKLAETNPADHYPPSPLGLRDSRRVSDHYRQLPQPNPLERAIAGVALSDMALRDGDYARSVRMSWLAVDNLLQTERCKTFMGNGVPDALRHDVQLLQATYLEARHARPSLRQAGEANATAKVLLSALAHRAGYRHGLEGVA